MLWWTHQKLRTSNPQTRLAVVQQLALEGEAKSVGLLILVLKDKDAEVRCAAAKALVGFHDRRAAGPLIEMLKDTVPLARAAASESLGKLGDPLAIDRLVPLLRDPDQIVRAVVARSLHRLGWRPSNDTQKIHQILALGNLQMLLTIGSEAVEPLLELMRYGPPNKQLAAVKTLGQIKDPRLTRSMLEALQKDSPAVRIAALDNLERIADPMTYPDVVKLLKDSNAGVRTTAVLAVVLLGERCEPLHCRRDVDAVQRKARCGCRLDLRDLEVHLLALFVGQLDKRCTWPGRQRIQDSLHFQFVCLPTLASAWSSGE